MYHGEVSVAQEELNAFLAVAEDLSIKGLTTGGQEEGTVESNSVRSRPKRQHQQSYSTPVKRSKISPRPSASSSGNRSQQQKDDDTDPLSENDENSKEPVIKMEPKVVATASEGGFADDIYGGDADDGGDDDHEFDAYGDDGDGSGEFDDGGGGEEDEPVAGTSSGATPEGTKGRTQFMR